MLEPPNTSILGKDPERKYRINANSFQQNAITTLDGWQYAAFYTDALQGKKKGSCHVNLARRRVLPSNGKWETLTFEDHEQTMDDGHNTVSIAVCKGDGTIHISFDHHCDSLRFRISKPGAALQLNSDNWNASLFTPTQDFLPGIPSNSLMKEVTYPRFVNIDNDLLLTYRIGQAGLGSDILYRYSSETHLYTYLGQHLTGISNSPYINGIDFRLSRLHISWCYRNVVVFDPSAGPDAHKQQAGPNGPENNFDLNYAYSDDLGTTWKSSDGDVLAQMGGEAPGESTIKPGAKGARIFEIPMGSGILNQESQAADLEGGFWALNRENRSGSQRWVVYYRDPEGKWSMTEIESFSVPTETGARASICAGVNKDIYLVLPGNSDSSLSIMKGGRNEGHVGFKMVWRGEGFDGEPLVDVQRLEMSDVLSVFTRTDKKGHGTRDVVVLDFDLASKVDEM